MQMTQEEQEKKREREKIARIQYRLPDGSSVTRNYPRDETLGSAIADLRNQPVQIPENFRLSMGIPRRIFSQEDERVSLGDLGLTPSASVLVQPVNNKKIQPKQDGMMAQCLAYVIMFLSFPLKIVSYIWSAIFGPQQSTSNEVVGGTSQSGDIRTGSGTQSVRRRNVPDKPVKRDGKTHRLSDVKRKDDDEATWNGNSTQQM
uniref:UBX domain-containing protein 4 n=1 Tax=Ciona savignyi TaxID=51511 RepID=H2Z2E8_CIOSA